MALTLQERQHKYSLNPENRTKILARQSARRMRLREQGLCMNCHIRPTIQGKTYCVECKARKADYHRARRAKHIAVGMCGNCGKKPPLPAMVHNERYRLCEKCYLQKTSMMRLGSRKLWRVLAEKLEGQNYRCAYTGDKLILGLNDSIDHILPASRYPQYKTDPANVEWVTREVNEMKRDRTPEEFLGLIQTILRHRKGINL